MNNSSILNLYFLNTFALISMAGSAEIARVEISLSYIPYLRMDFQVSPKYPTSLRKFLNWDESAIMDHPSFPVPQMIILSLPDNNMMYDHAYYK